MARPEVLPCSVLACQWIDIGHIAHSNIRTRSPESEMRSKPHMLQVLAYKGMDQAYREPLQMLLSLRTLQQDAQAVAPAEITIVSTPEGFVDAIQGGALDIVITDHLDLTTVPLKPTSICEGRCTTQPDAANFPGMNGVPMVATTSGQCFLLTHDDMLGVVNGQFWADNLYLRAALPEGVLREFHFPALVVVPALSTGGIGSVYLTNMIFQGDGEGSVVGIGADDKVYVQDSWFTSLGGARNLSCTECSSAIEARAAVAIQGCRFDRLVNQPGSRYFRAYKGGSVRSENTTYAAATKAFEVADSGDDKGIGVFCEESTIRLEITEAQFDTRPPEPLDAVPAEDPENPGLPLFLSSEDAWFVAVQQELAAAEIPSPDDGTLGPVAAAAADATEEEALEEAATSRAIQTGSTDDNGSTNGRLVLGVTLACAAVVVVAAAVLLLLRRRSHHKQQQQVDLLSKAASHTGSRSHPAYSTGSGAVPHPSHRSHHGSTGSRSLFSVPYAGSQWQQTSMKDPSTDGNGGPTTFPPDGAADALRWLNVESAVDQCTPSHEANVPGALAPSSSSNVWSSGVPVVHAAFNKPTTYDTLTIQTTTTAPGNAPDDGASMHDRMHFLHTQLDSLGSRRLLDRFVLSGPHERRQGGQGLVAFATGALDKLDYAVKFFLHRPSFHAERALYKSQTLGKLLPQIEGVYDPLETAVDGLILDRSGNKLPPFLVMEKGESLIDWSKRNRSDVFQAVAVLAHVAMRLKDLHNAGYVHRDIKPGNIMLLHRKNRWTLIDFGCVAPIDELAGLSFTLHYAAPEAVETWYRGDKRILAKGALDAWALGVVAFELLTRKQAFQMLVQGKDKVVACLQGEEELPWEGDHLKKVERKLGKMREPVLALLHRDPAQRMTAAQFVRECNALFAVDTMDLAEATVPTSAAPTAAVPTSTAPNGPVPTGGSVTAAVGDS